MSVMFLEPVYPTPGHVHRRRLQLVEVSGGRLGPRSPRTVHGPKGHKGPSVQCPLRDGQGSWGSPGSSHTHVATLIRLPRGRLAGRLVPAVSCPFVSLSRRPGADGPPYLHGGVLCRSRHTHSAPLQRGGRLFPIGPSPGFL